MILYIKLFNKNMYKKIKPNKNKKTIKTKENLMLHIVTLNLNIKK